MKKCLCWCGCKVKWQGPNARCDRCWQGLHHHHELMYAPPFVESIRRADPEDVR